MDPEKAKIFTAILTSAILIGSIIIYFIISIIRQQRRNLELQRLNILTEINTLESERARMAADLHDELGPTLSSIRFRIESVEAADEEEQVMLTKAGSQINDTIARIREIAGNLMPQSLIRKGLITGTTEFIHQFAHPTLNIQFGHSIQTELSQEKSINIYRIIQEIIQNTAKHAQATKLVIQLIEEKGKLVLLCEDNGTGFNYQQIVREKTGIGLRNLKSRTEIMGGKMTVYSVSGKGSQFRFEVPLP